MKKIYERAQERGILKSRTYLLNQIHDHVSEDVIMMINALLEKLEVESIDMDFSNIRDHGTHIIDIVNFLRKVNNYR